MPSTEDIQLPSNVSSLIHHVELNSEGWWDGAREDLVMAAIWLLDKPQPPEEIASYVREKVHAGIDPSHVGEIIDSLEEKSRVVRGANDRIKLAEQERRHIKARYKEAKALDKRVKDRFQAKIRQYCEDLTDQSGDIWDEFVEKALVPLIRKLGAKAYNIVTGKTTTVAQRHLTRFLNHFNPTYRRQLREAIQDFLDPSNESVRQYVLRYLNAYFCFSAAGVDRETLDGLTKSNNTKPKFRLFVDTNFLFSLLDIHDNPANEAAQRLAALTKTIAKYVDVEFRVVPLTIKEAKAVLAYTKNKLKDTRINATLARAAQETYLSGIEKKFFSRCAESQETLSVEAYFEPYLENLSNMCEQSSVHLHNAKLESYHKENQSCIDDINYLHDIEEAKEDGKGYEAIRHDMSLWHFVRENRRYAESPLEAVYWVLTVDNNLLRFDQRKVETEDLPLPICIDPSTLVQLLQFWVPRSEETDKAVVGALRLPFLFEEFDKEAEEVTISILNAMSRYENLDDVDPSTATQILTDEALRDAIYNTDDEDKQQEYIESALLQENQRKASKLEKAREKVKKQESQLEEKAKKLNAVRESLEKEKSERTKLEERQAKAEEARRKLAEQLEEEAEKRQMVEARWLFRMKFFGYVFVCFVLVNGLWIPVSYAVESPIWPVALALNVAGPYVCVKRILKIGAEDEKLINDTFYKILRNAEWWAGMATWIVAFAAAVITLLNGLGIASF